MKRLTDYAETARPDLPKPTCRVVLVCGPPASGKSTYVRSHADPYDIVIDVDLIAREHGLGRDRDSSNTGDLLAERNRRLAALAEQPANRVAWVIVGAPSASLRNWWRQTLHVQPDDLVLLTPTRQELQRRIMADPDRRDVQQHHLMLVDKWFAKDDADDPGIIKGGVDADGWPLDPLHHWNRE